MLQVFGNGPTLWLVGAFAVGMAAGPRPLIGLVLGTVTLVAAVAVYYALIVLADTRPGAGLAPALAAWIAVAAVAGPVMGAAGSLSRDDRPMRQMVGLSVLAGALFAMGLFITPQVPIAGVPHLVAGALVAQLAEPGWRARTLGLAAVIGVIGFGVTQLAFLGVQELLRP